MSKRKNIESVETESADINAERIAGLRELFPEAFSEGKVDFAKLREALGDIADDRPERYSFSWSGKRDAIRMLQTPSRATLKPCREESVNFDETKHLFLEGDNLEVLKLLYKSYAGRVKMIYIDPPYNTGKDFIYPDNFADPLDTYLRLTGQKDAEGNVLTSNPETSGRYHSAWLSMMYPRLFIARQLLREDGVIFVSIDDHEVHNLRMVMNEVFGEENFVDCMIWKKRYGGGAKEKYLVSLHEYIAFYARNREALGNLFAPYDEESIERYYTLKDEKYETRGGYRTHPLEATKSMGQRQNLVYPIPAPDGTEVWPRRQWLWARERTLTALAKGEIQSIRGKDGKWTVHSKQYLRDESGTIRQTKVFSIIEDVYTQHGTGEILDHFGDAHVFPFPKPTKLLKTFLQLCCAEQDSESQIIVDLFAGSGSTAQSILSLNREDQSNRRFIMVQIPEPTMRDDFSTIADIGKERIRRVIAKMKSEREGELDLQTRETPEDLGFRVFKLEESHFRRWTGTAEKDPGELAEQMELFNDPLLPGWTPEDVLWEITLKEGLSLTSRIEPVVPAISAAKPRRDAKSALNTVWRITDDDKNQSLLVCLDDKLNPETFRALDLDRETRFICRNAALTDELAANLALQCRLKTI